MTHLNKYIADSITTNTAIIFIKCYKLVLFTDLQTSYKPFLFYF